MKNKKVEVEERKPKEVKLKSEMYNHDNENIIKKDDTYDEPNEAMMWGFVLGFILFFIILICIIVITNR